ncbi:uncharacterized protein LOC108100706 [Drosophila ficusphila]|uniref:uncharacterized protein LOC108100706 n=1 Tax=Drosophila ficusphila TaxID=30025 RepID=UPI0007E74B8C|nr:uncharacterized protein LOC108100706 [Drosophila ficusphila]
MRLNEPAEKTRPRTKATTEATKYSSSGDLHLECSIYNLIRLLLLIATIMGGGFVQAKSIYDTVNRIQGLDPLVEPSSSSLDLPSSSKVPRQTTAATPTAAPLQVSTLRSSYDPDSNGIDNSFPAEGSSQAVPEDSDSDGVDEDYIIPEGQTSSLPILEQEVNLVKGQDMESLSLQSGGGTGDPKAQPDPSGRKNSFQPIGSQNVNALVPATVATTSLSGGSSNASSVATPTEPARNRSTGHVHNSAVKVDSKHPLAKGQKTDAPMLNYIFDTFSSANKHHHHDQRYGPHFEDVQRLGQATNLTVQAGSSIHLNCRISLLQDKTVSWVRHNTQAEDNALDLLTVGMHTYTGDKRYKMEFQYPNNWRLKITNVKKDDEAIYECQISTHPPRVIQINLHVNAPKVMIVDEVGDPLQEKYYEIDSTLQLSCVVRNVAMTSSVVFWKHIDNILNYDVTRGGVSVKTELMEDGANSTLSIAKISKTDSGNYTCSISEFQNFTIVVHILNGESFAELHHGGAGGLKTKWCSLVVLHLVALLTLSSLRGEFS